MGNFNDKFSCVLLEGKIHGAVPESISAANSQNIASFGTKLIVFLFPMLEKHEKFIVQHLRIMSLLSPEFKEAI